MRGDRKFMIFVESALNDIGAHVGIRRGWVSQPVGRLTTN